MSVNADVLGVRVDAGSPDVAVAEISKLASAGRGGYVCVANVHMLVTAKLDEPLRAIIERAFMVVSDGMPLVWSLRWRGFAADRVAGPDLMVSICERAAKESIPIYLFGGREETLVKINTILSGRFPGLNIAGAAAPPMLPDSPRYDAAAAEQIVRSGARIVFVGLGCPKQERWMAAHAEAIPAVLIGVGAAFDFVAGTKSRAPLWMQRSGLEWFYRLASEPRRLGRRYLVTNSLFLWMTLVDAVRGRRKSGRGAGFHE